MKHPPPKFIINFSGAWGLGGNFEWGGKFFGASSDFKNIECLQFASKKDPVYFL